MNVLEPRWDYIQLKQAYKKGYPTLELGMYLEDVIKVCELDSVVYYEVVYIISDGEYKTLDLKEAKRILKLCLI